MGLNLRVRDKIIGLGLGVMVKDVYGTKRMGTKDTKCLEAERREGESGQYERRIMLIVILFVFHAFHEWLSILNSIKYYIVIAMFHQA